VDRIKEEVRHERGVTLIEEAVSDIRAAFRQMRHHPVVAGVIVLTLAVGVGFNTAVFTVVKTVVLGELPYSAADRLVVLWSDSKSYSPAPALSGPDFFDYRDQTTRLEGIAAAWGNRGGLNAPGGAPEYVQWAKVSANFFEVLRVTPAVGRSFTLAFDTPEGPREAILSHGMWRRRFGGDPAVVGTTIDLNGEPVTVIGVLPEGFRLWTPPETFIWAPPIDVWTNLRYGPESFPRGQRHLFTIGRLRPGTTLAEANAEAASVSAYLRTTLPRYAENEFTVSVRPLTGGVVRAQRPVLLALWGAVVLALLIAVTNLASLFLGRAVQRQGEFGLRAALGASRGRLLRQLLTESLILAAIGGLGGVTIAAATLEYVQSARSIDIPLLEYATLDGPALAMAVVLAISAGVLFGLAPAMKAFRSDAARWFASRTTGGLEHRRALRSMVVAQAALSLVLLISAGLVVRSMLRLLSRDLGFDPTGVTTLTVILPPSRYDTPEKRIDFYRELETRLAALSGVHAVGGVNLLPLAGAGTSGHY